MKKLILLGLIAALLLATGVAGGVYAAISHEPLSGDKLVGFAPFGTKVDVPGEPLPKVIDDCIFRFNNPDCVNDITIQRISILKYDGSVVYEGPYLRIKANGNRVPASILKPHQGGIIELNRYMYDGIGDPRDASSWLSPEDARNQVVSAYTVEIFWSAKGGTSRLIGFGQYSHTRFELVIPGEPAAKYPSTFGVPMFDMKQREK